MNDLQWCLVLKFMRAVLILLNKPAGEDLHSADLAFVNQTQREIDAQ